MTISANIRHDVNLLDGNEHKLVDLLDIDDTRLNYINRFSVGDVFKATRNQLCKYWFDGERLLRKRSYTTGCPLPLRGSEIRQDLESIRQHNILPISKIFSILQMYQQLGETVVNWGNVEKQELFESIEKNRNCRIQCNGGFVWFTDKCQLDRGKRDYDSSRVYEVWRMFLKHQQLFNDEQIQSIYDELKETGYFDEIKV